MRLDRFRMERITRAVRRKDILDLFVFLTGKALHVSVDALGLRETPAHDPETITGEGREQRADVAA
jgi:hypothetical protein